MADSRKITIYIFLFALFIMLGMVVGTRIYNIYTGSRAESERTIESTMMCSFSYSLSSIEYKDMALDFDLKTSDMQLLKKLVVETEQGQKREVELGTFIGFRQHVKVDNILLGDSFFVYPDGCGNANRKNCSLLTAKCANVKAS